MNKLSLAMCCTLLIGCRGVNRLLNGPDPEPKTAQAISSVPAMPESPPTFNVPIPPDTTKKIFYGEMPISGFVQIDPHATCDVFMFDRVIGQWFRIYTGENAFWYTYSASTGTLQIHGEHLENKGYCIYQYTQN